MQYTSETLERVIKEFTKLPSIGRKTAQRLAFHLLKLPKEEAASLSQAILDLKEKIIRCSVCYNITEKDPCSICQNAKRDRGVLCVVEEANDVLAIERTDMFRGLYHVLGGLLNPLDGVGPNDLNIQALRERMAGLRELILAINPTVTGDATVMFLVDHFKDTPVKITRIARGIPIGSDLEFADMTTLTRAMEGRVAVQTQTIMETQ